MMIATIHSGFAVKKGDTVAGMRVIPLVIEKEKLKKAQSVAVSAPIIRVVPFHQR